MDLTNDPNDRRRVDPEAQRARDAEVAGLRRSGVPFRQIAAALGMSLGSVQKALARATKSSQQESASAVLADERVYAEDLTREQLEDFNVWRQLDPLERFRFAHIPGGRPVPRDDDHQQCCIRHSLDPDARPDPDARRTAGHPWPSAERDDDDW